MSELSRIGLFGIGLDTYWPQFAGLKERLTGYQDYIAGRLSAQGAEVLDAGLVDSPEAARRAAELFASGRVEMIFVYIANTGRPRV